MQLIGRSFDEFTLLRIRCRVPGGATDFHEKSAEARMSNLVEIRNLNNSLQLASAPSMP